MPFTLIKGTFQIVGYQPDGDSIRFLADNLVNWDLLDGPIVELNARQHAQLRIEAIDTLETHYQGFHQPLKFANAGTKFLLHELGIKNVKFGQNGLTVVSAQDGTRGYILSRKTEGNRRPVAFVFAGDPPEADGASVFLKTDRLESSLNFKSAKEGLAYPTYYEGLFPDLRKKITDTVTIARNAPKGLWKKDKTNKGFDVSTLSGVTDKAVILPKLFRRIVSFMGNGGGIAGFKQFLETNPDPVFELTAGHSTNLDTFVEVQGHTVRLTVEPERLIFKETA
jgi:hypothetical protein